MGKTRTTPEKTAYPLYLPRNLFQFSQQRPGFLHVRRWVKVKDGMEFCSWFQRTESDREGLRGTEKDPLLTEIG